MKINSFYSGAIASICATAMLSCSSLKPLSENYFTATPSPLETVGKNISGTINGTFPEKWFDKNAVVVITPVLKYENNHERKGASYTFQGENVMSNHAAIDYQRGGNMAINFTFPYAPEMQTSELFLRFDGRIKNKRYALPDIKVADGVIATSTFASVKGTSPSYADDGFQRIIKKEQQANIHFMIQQAALRADELNKEDIKTWKQRVQEAFADPKQDIEVEISAYASPDGGQSLNEQLAAEREKNTSKYLSAELKRQNVNAPIYTRYTAQDWEGFRQLVEASDLQDKELILRVLEMYPDSEAREREIKNISFIYDELASTILPQLRRSRITANIRIVGKSDEEILALWKKDPHQLSVEELLYASTLVADKAEKENIYQFASNKYPQDYRGWNNLAALFFEEGDLNKTKVALKRAEQVNPEAPEVNMNKALLAMMDNHTEKAREYLGKASGANGLDEAMGLFYLMEGEYEQATQSFGNAKTNNAALAHILTKNYNTALNTLEEIKNPDAVTSYLTAIVAARTNDPNEAVRHLRSAITLDRNMATRAKNDIEFSKLRFNRDFVSLVNN